LTHICNRCVGALKLVKFKDHDGKTRSLKDAMTYIEVENGKSGPRGQLCVINPNRITI
jgi:hypothetical protein